MNAAQIIVNKFGGQTALSKLIDKRQGAIGYWCKTGVIPAKWRPQLIGLAKENGFELTPASFDNLIEDDDESIYLVKRKATHEGKLLLGENSIELNCAVLQDGTRVISQTSIFKAFGRTQRGRGFRDIKAKQLNVPTFIDAQNIQPFVSEELSAKLKRIDFIDKNGKESNGYDALILPLLCKVYHDARADGALKKSQNILARTSEILLFSLSKIGIIALVDEATGYQYDRERDELQKILGLYIAEELLPWQKRFPDEFYKEIFRLRKWDFTVSGIKQRPGVIGTWTKNLIYKQLPKGVLQELYTKTPKSSSGKLSAKLHQSLTADVGNPHLEKQLVSVITLMNVSDSWAHFEKLFQRKFGQLTLDFETVEMIEPQK